MSEKTGPETNWFWCDVMWFRCFKVHLPIKYGNTDPQKERSSGSYDKLSTAGRGKKSGRRRETCKGSRSCFLSGRWRCCHLLNCGVNQTLHSPKCLHDEDLTPVELGFFAEWVMHKHFKVVINQLLLKRAEVPCKTIWLKVFLSSCRWSTRQPFDYHRGLKQSDSHYTGRGDRIVHHRVLNKRGSSGVRLKDRCEKYLPLNRSGKKKRFRFNNGQSRLSSLFIDQRVGPSLHPGGLNLPAVRPQLHLCDNNVRND